MYDEEKERRRENINNGKKRYESFNLRYQ